MTLNDPLANALSTIWNADKIGKLECNIHTSYKLIVAILEIMKKNNYISDFKVKEDNKGSTIHIKLTNKINKCSAIKPRYAVKIKDYEKFEKRYLPAKNMGIILVSTNKGVLIHHEAKDKAVGGRLLAYCY